MDDIFSKNRGMQTSALKYEAEHYPLLGRPDYLMRIFIDRLGGCEIRDIHFLHHKCECTIVIRIQRCFVW